MCDNYDNLNCNPVYAKYTFCYDFNSEETVINSFDGAEENNSFSTSLRNYTDCKGNVAGDISFQTARITNANGSFLNEVVNFIDEHGCILIARSFYRDSGSGGESGAGSAWYKVMDASGEFAGIKMVRIVFNDDGTRDVSMFTGTCGKVGGTSKPLNTCNSLGFLTR